MPHPADIAGMPRVAQWRGRVRDSVYAMLHGLVPGESAIAMARTDQALDDAHFEQALCRNCGRARSEPHCGACGQPAVARLDLKDVWKEFWQARRLFEKSMLKGALEMVRYPGLVAREYVLGARKRHVHPLKLMLFAVGLLVIVLAKTQFLTAGQAEYSEQMKLVAAWSRWSFTLSLFAIWLTTLAVFRGRLGYNAVEHLVLAVYAQFLIIALKLVNLLPLLVLDSGWAQAWRAAAKWYVAPFELLIVAVALVQFFRLQWRRDWLRLAIALLLFVLLKRVLLYGYGRLIAELVARQAA